MGVALQAIVGRIKISRGVCTLYTVHCTVYIVYYRITQNIFNY